MFLRGHGYQDHSKLNGSRNGITNTRHQSGNLGEIQGDASRNFNGWIGSRPLVGDSIANHSDENPIMPAAWGWGGIMDWEYVASANYTPLEYAHDVNNLLYGRYGTTMDLQRRVPVANEIRPINIAVKYIIKAK